MNYVDISSHQAAAGTIDLRAYWDAGHTDLMLKATQGTEYAWDGMQPLAREWHSFGPQYRVGYYHWLYATVPAASQHGFFWGQAAPVWRAGDWTMTDFEDVDPSRWRSDAVTLPVLKEFDARCSAHGYHDVYTGNWFIADLPLCRAYLKTQNVVMSDYTNNPPANPYGLSYDAHQFTSSATVAGMPGRVDYNRWLADAGLGGGVPITIPGGDDSMSADDVAALQAWMNAKFQGTIDRIVYLEGELKSGHLAQTVGSVVGGGSPLSSGHNLPGAEAKIIAAVTEAIAAIPAPAPGQSSLTQADIEQAVRNVLHSA